MLFYIINVNLILYVFFLVFNLSYCAMSMAEPLIPMAHHGVILQTKEKMERVGTRLQKKNNQPTDLSEARPCHFNRSLSTCF